MAKLITSKSRRLVREVHGVQVLHGNAAQLGTFKHFRMGHELAVPTYDTNGQQVFRTPTGKTYTVRKLSS